MEPPQGFLYTLGNFICFLPYFVGLLLLGTIKGIILCPPVCIVIMVGNSSIILGLLPYHCYFTYYSIVRAKLLGPFLKLVIFVFLPIVLILGVVVGIVGSIFGGILYGFLSPIFATFDAVGEGKTDVFFHCFYDGTWSTVKGSFTVVKDFCDVCFHSYNSFMEDLQQKEPPNGQYYEIRILYLLPALIAAVLGSMADFPVISLIALCKSPYMLFKGWHRLFHDLIGREGPFLETICVPFAGLAILLWPLVVVGAVLARWSLVSSLVPMPRWLFTRNPRFGSGFVTLLLPCPYMMNTATMSSTCQKDLACPGFIQHSSHYIINFGKFCYELSLTNRPQYRRNRRGSIPRSDSLRPRPPARIDSLTNTRLELNPLELLEGLFDQCRVNGEKLVSEGLITSKDIEEAKSIKGSRVVSIGLPAYCFLQALLRSVEASKSGILLSDNTEITATNRPKDTIFDWFLNPFLILKEQIKAENLSEEEKDYLGKLVLLCGDPAWLKDLNIGSPPESERKRAELCALARRLQGITKSVSRYPTFRRHFEKLVNSLSEDLSKKDSGGSGNSNSRSSKGDHRPAQRSKSSIARLFSNNSFKGSTSYNMSDQESQAVLGRDVQIE
ncbi:Detected protein of confused Function [Hibiscus syriacus]|uniref:Detected protein of confused Function n=1 Tax=Hibiscus syriacus TaxID=106335 RepID=A0A6A3D1U3_HIBSY|nr:Detected protein of confused Function [Hibiscus syriacus]